MAQETFYLKGRVGMNVAGAADNGEVDARFGRLGELMTSQIRGKYAEQAARGFLYSAMCAATTTGVAAGNITNAAAAAVANFAVWNPPGSAVNVHIEKVWIGVISGTPVGGPMFHNIFAAPPLTLVPIVTGGYCGPVNPSKGAGVAKAWSVAAGSAITGGGAYTAQRQSQLDFSATAFANAGGGNGVEDIDGSIILPPGYGWAPCWQAAGTTLLNAYSALYSEVPIIGGS